MKRAVLALSCLGLVALAAQSAAAATPARVAVRMSSRAAASRRRSATAPMAQSARISLTVSFAPRHRKLLGALAGDSSGTSGLSASRLRALFGPDPREVAGTTSFLRGHGLRETGRGLLTRTFAGSAADVEAAFATRLVSYHLGSAIFRATSSSPTLPADVAAGVSAVDGLNTSPLYRPMATTPPPLQVVSKCSATSSGTPSSHFPGGYEPSALASSSAYDYQSLMSASHEGQGNTLALVEFSGYDASPVATYQSCYSTHVPITDVAVNGGATDSNGAVEVQLDEEVAAGNAPGLDGIYSYEAASSAGMDTVLDRILADRATTHVDEISISWGACEAAVSPAEVSAADAEFQLAAAAGVSVYVASGDDGASDCRQFNGSTAPAVDYPASDPWVTAVGGTTLTTSATGPNHETSWGQPQTFSGGGGGGGVSTLFAMPAWQTGAGVNEPGYSSSTACGQTTALCREVPDIALDANPDSGYVVRVTTPLGNAWAQVGGTSAAAPLMAAMTADIDTASAAVGGQPLGFANPFLYAHPGVFHDITVGSNSELGVGLPYPAGVGYDMATGLGSPDGSALAAALIAATTLPSADSTVLSATQSSTTLTPAAPVTISGSLTDSTTPTHLVAGRTVTVSGTYTVAGVVHTVAKTATTDAGGNWSVPVTTADIGARFTWQAKFAGDGAFKASQTGSQALMVQPTLTTSSNLHWNGKQYSGVHPVVATLSGVSTPAMAGAVLTVQTKASGSTKWVSTTTTVTVAADGSYSTPFTFGAAVKESIRFNYAGKASGPWLSAKSPAKVFSVT
ncbi:MAG TPA: S53 family peptidase [Gaiellales bacterium]|nr:S53 family peptidase [Gaiellales bacterium]